MTQDQLKKLIEALDRIADEIHVANLIAAESVRAMCGDDTDKTFAVRAVGEHLLEPHDGTL